MLLDATQTLRELVRIPSINPMGRAAVGDEFFEHRVTDYLQATFERLGLSFLRQAVEPKRENIFARLEGDVPPEEGGGLMMWEAHQDTVPVDGMVIDPFGAEVRDGRVYGRGACDIKGGMAAMLAALARLHEQRPPGLPTIVMACTVNEEHGYSGAAAVAEAWRSGDHPFFPRLPDRVIVAEPTSLSVVVAHKGVVRWTCRTRGKAAHSSNPHLGENAVYKMSRVILALEKYAAEIVPTLGKHPRVGSPTLSVGVVAGGLSVNTIPDWCEIQIDRRVLPGEDPFAARAQVIEHLRREVAEAGPLDHEEPFITARGLCDDANGPLGRELAEAAGGRGGGMIGVSYGTDAAVYSAAGAPSVVFGPGSIEQAHTCDEWLEIEQLEAAAEILYRFASAG